jgi:hypothetical protein
LVVLDIPSLSPDFAGKAQGHGKASIEGENKFSKRGVVKLSESQWNIAFS